MKTLFKTHQAAGGESNFAFDNSAGLLVLCGIFGGMLLRRK